MNMSKSPFQDVNDAFDPMYNEDVVIVHETERMTVEVAVFTNGTDDPLTDDLLDSERESIHLVCKRKDWAYVSKLLRGDTIKRTATNGLMYSIYDVKFDALMGWCIYARSV